MYYEQSRKGGAYMLEDFESFSQKERVVQAALFNQLVSSSCGVQRPTPRSVIVGLVGVVGSGKSSVAYELSKLIGAVVVESDEIRLALRATKESFDNVRLIARNVALTLADCGINVVLDSDFIDAKKRADLRKPAKALGFPVYFVCVYADLDVMIGRMVSERCGNDFFAGAPSDWHGSYKGSVVKIREMIRRLPLHYHWINEGGGRWEIKKPPCKVLADIDTGAEGWREEVKKCAERILTL